MGQLQRDWSGCCGGPATFQSLKFKSCLRSSPTATIGGVRGLATGYNCWTSIECTNAMILEFNHKESMTKKKKMKRMICWHYSGQMKGIFSRCLEAKRFLMSKTVIFFSGRDIHQGNHFIHVDGLDRRYTDILVERTVSCGYVQCMRWLWLSLWLNMSTMLKIPCHKYLIHLIRHQCIRNILNRCQPVMFFWFTCREATVCCFSALRIIAAQVFIFMYIVDKPKLTYSCVRCVYIGNISVKLLLDLLLYQWRFGPESFSVPLQNRDCRYSQRGCPRVLMCLF